MSSFTGLLPSGVCLARPPSKVWAPIILVHSRFMTMRHTARLWPVPSVPLYGGNSLDGDHAAGVLQIQKQLTRDMMSAQTPTEILKILYSGEHRSLLNLTAALLKIAKLAHRAKEKELRQSAAMQRLFHDVEVSHDTWNAVHICNVLEACGRLQLRDSGLQQRAESELRQKVDCLLYKPLDVVGVLQSLVRLPQSQVRGIFLQRVSDIVLRSCAEHSQQLAQAHISEQEVAAHFPLDSMRLWHFRDDLLGHLAWSLTEANCSADVADCLFQEARRRGLENLPRSTLALVARCAAERGSANAALAAVDALAGCIVVLDEGENARHAGDQPFRRFDDAVMLLHAFAGLVKNAAGGDFRSESSLKWTTRVLNLRRQLPQVNTAAMAVLDWCFTGIPTANARHLCAIAHALAQLQIPSQRMLATIEQRALIFIKALSPRSLATLCWSFATLRYDSPKFMEAAAWSMLQHVTHTREEKSRKRAPSDSVEPECISMLLHAYALMDSFNGEQGRKLLLAMVKIALRQLPDIETCALPLLGWSVMVAKENSIALEPREQAVIHEFFGSWRGAVVTRAPALLRCPGGLTTLHHVEMALRLDKNATQSAEVATSQAYNSFFQSLYDSGRVRFRAAQDWETQIPYPEVASGPKGTASDGGRKVSRFQRQVYEAARSLDHRWVMEHWEQALGYPVDVALPGHRVTSEADGPTHFAANTLRALGTTMCKRRLLDRLGWTVISIPFFEWSVERNKGAYLRRKLEAAGIRLEQEERERDEHRNIDYSAPMAKRKNAPAEMHAAPSQPESTTDAVVQRAQRLDLVRLRRGQMSRVDLAKRAAQRKSSEAP